WRSVKYEEIYLHEHATLIGLCAGLEKWFARYNDWRPHEALENRTPRAIYDASGDLEELAKPEAA
ncbi:transposase, partial [Roseibacillus ishigakijimensis]|nr:transposase [Roseibacillus ishigakijimensis]